MNDLIMFAFNNVMIIINLINLKKAIKYKAKGLMTIILIAMVLLSISNILCLHSILSILH